MKRFWTTKVTVVVAVVTAASLVAFPIGGHSSLGHPALAEAAEISSGPTAGMEKYATLTTTTPLEIESALTELANNFVAIPDFSGTTIPGQQLRVKLNQTGSTAQRLPNRPQAKPRKPVVSKRGRPVAKTQSKPQTAIRGTNKTYPAGLVDQIDCTLFPALCQEIPLPDPANPTGPPKLKLINIKPQVEWSIFARDNPNPLTEGKDFQSTPLQGLSKMFVIAPLTTAELTPSNPPTTDYTIMAKVTLTADRVLIADNTSTPVTSTTIPLEVPLNLSALPVPTIFVLFMDKDFGRAAAVYVPANSTLSETILPDLVRKVADTYNPVASRLNFVSWFATYLTGLRTLQHTFALPWDLKELKDVEENLNNDDFIHTSPFTSANDREVEDESSSLLLIGVPGTGAKFFQKQEREGKSISVETGLEMTVLIRDFENLSSVPAEGLCNNGFGTNANNSFSSFEWLKDGTACPGTVP